MGIRTASHRATNDAVFALVTSHLGQRPGKSLQVLDLGCGRGAMARRVGDWLTGRGMNASAHLVASDIDEAIVEAREIPFKRLDFNDPLPFPDASLDLVYSIEVLEHMHRPYDLLRECHRVLKPGGALVMTTPNILHLTSRLRFLFTGFFDLFQPPSTLPANAGRLCGHVMPLHLAYYAYGLRLAGFHAASYRKDKAKRTSTLASLLLFPIFWLARKRFARRIEKYDAAVHAENAQALEKINSFQMLTSRSLVLLAEKPSR